VPVEEIGARASTATSVATWTTLRRPSPTTCAPISTAAYPIAEIDALERFWSNYPDLRTRCFRPRQDSSTEHGDAYLDFAPEVTDRRALAAILNGDGSVAAAHAAFLETLEAWWGQHLPAIAALAPSDGPNGTRPGNVYALRRHLLASIEQTFVDTKLLTGHQIRGAFARYVDELKADLKSIAASGWGPELIPDADILESQFPEVLAEMDQKRTRLAELAALLAAADEEDYEDEDDTGVLPSGEVKAFKAKLKQLKGEARLAKRDPNLGDYRAYEKEAAALEARLERHKMLEDEARQLKADLRATEKRQDDLVAAAREKIDRDEARKVIVERLHRLLVRTYESYLRADQRACLAALENLHAKYAVTAAQIEGRRDAATAKLKGFLEELGYA
jgi:type I restriction enzyme M protein